jgi:arylsulfatase B
MFTRNYSRGYDLRRDIKVDRSYKQLYATDMLTKEAISVIENSGKENPFFLIVNHLAPHAGNYLSDSY